MYPGLLIQLKTPVVRALSSSRVLYPLYPLYPIIMPPPKYRNRAMGTVRRLIDLPNCVLDLEGLIANRS